MYQQFLLTLLTLGAPLASADYQNITSFGNEIYDRAGYEALITGNTRYDYLNWNGFTDLLFANDDGESTVGQPEFEGCNGLCAASFPYGLQFNVTEPTQSVELTPDSDATYGFDLYELDYACFVIGPNGTDAQGQETYGRVPHNCTILTSATTIEGKKLVKLFHFKAQGIPSNLTYGTWPSTFRNLTSVYFNATSKPTKKFPYAPVVAIDNLSYGAEIDD